MKNQYSLNTITTAVVLILVIFTCFVAYKYIATGIQEKKEKAIIQARGEQNAPESTKQPKESILPKSEACSIQSEVEAARIWIHTCYLKNLLTEECKKVFDVNGYYLIDPASSQGDQLYSYLENAQTCGCKLPAEMADRLNNDADLAKKRCPAITIN